MSSNWLPTEAEVQAAIARQRAYNMRMGTRIEGDESIYVPLRRQQKAPVVPGPVGRWARIRAWITRRLGCTARS